MDLSRSALSVEDFCSYVTKRRERESLEAIGQSLGVSHASVLHWLKGTRVPGRTVRLLAGALSRRDPGTWPLGPSNAQDGPVQLVRHGERERL